MLYLDNARCELVSNLWHLPDRPGGAMCREMLERATLDDNCIRAQHRRVHRRERDHVEERTIAREARKIKIDLCERPAQIERGADIEGVEHLEAQCRVALAGALDTLGAD